jgi:hypothetical protein
MKTEYIEIIGKILGWAIVVIITYLTPKVNAWLVEKVGAEKAEKLRKLIEELVAAAEQMFKEDDPTGEIRKKYVEQQVEALGYQITEDVNAMIESMVWRLNQSNDPLKDYMKELVEDGQSVHTEA